MRTIVKRLIRGDDLMKSIRAIAKEASIGAGVILSGAGCTSAARIRDASGTRVRELGFPCEIVSLTGTVSKERCHIHIALSGEDMVTFGGHLMEGTIVNTTCELVIGVLNDWRFSACEDPETGFDELVAKRIDGTSGL